jgi:hypothetical protein
MINHEACTIAACLEEEFQEAKENQNNGWSRIWSQGKVFPDVKEKSQDSKSQPQDPRSDGGTAEQPVKEQPKALHPPTDCVLRKGLPVIANDHDILDFILGVGVFCLSVWGGPESLGIFLSSP